MESLLALFSGFANEQTLAQRVNFPSPNRVTGTWEWAQRMLNCCNGCANDCLYCYARIGAVCRFKARSGKTWDMWKDMILREEVVNHGYMHSAKMTMFPTTHDIVPADKTYPSCLLLIEKNLQVGNRMLITSKPAFAAIDDITTKFKNYIDLIKFRFTITTMNADLMSRYELHAPSLSERIKCAEMAHERGFNVTFSIEPALDNPARLIERLSELTNEIWLGIMNPIWLRFMKKYINHDLTDYLQSLYAEAPTWLQGIQSKEKIYIKETLASTIIKQKGM